MTTKQTVLQKILGGLGISEGTDKKPAMTPAELVAGAIAGSLPAPKKEDKGNVDPQKEIDARLARFSSMDIGTAIPSEQLAAITGGNAEAEKQLRSLLNLVSQYSAAAAHEVSMADSLTQAKSLISDVKGELPTLMSKHGAQKTISNSAIASNPLLAVTAQKVMDYITVQSPNISEEDLANATIEALESMGLTVNTTETQTNVNSLLDDLFPAIDESNLPPQGVEATPMLIPNNGGAS